PEGEEGVLRAVARLREAGAPARGGGSRAGGREERQREGERQQEDSQAPHERFLSPRARATAHGDSPMRQADERIDTTCALHTTKIGARWIARRCGASGRMAAGPPPRWRATDAGQ